MAQVIDLDGGRAGRRRRSGADAVAAGAQRASGERARRRRRTTPLLAELEPAPPSAPADGSAESSDQTSDHTSAEPSTEEVTKRAVPRDDSGRPDATPRVATTRRTPRPPAATSAGEHASATPAVAPTRPAGRKVAARSVAQAAEPPAQASAGPPVEPPAGPSDQTSDQTSAETPTEPAVGTSTEPPAAKTPRVARTRQVRQTRPPRQAGQARTARPVVRPVAAGPATGAAAGTGGRRPRARAAGPERLVAVADLATRTGERIADALEDSRPPGDVEEKIAAALAFLRRRLTGDYEVDEFGFDRELTESVLLAVVRPLYKRWFRVEVRGIENIPDTGGALVVANHSGAVALDSVMTQIAVHDTHPQHRFLRMLGADLVFQTPFVGEIARKGGATLAANGDAERLLSSGEVVGVWPEGFKGIGKPFSERYKLQRFGRGGFVSAALRTRRPIVPCAIVGAEETYPIIGNLPTLARLLGLPYFPVTPTFPLFGPLGAIPLPSKWLIEFGAPVPTDEFDSGAAEDPMLIFDLTDQVRQTIQQTLYSLLVQRRSVFF